MPNIFRLFMNSFVLTICLLSTNLFAQQQAWESQDSGTSNFLNEVFFADSSYGWAVGRNGNRILHTTNSGITWENQISPTFRSLQSVYFVDRNLGWAAGGDYFHGQTASGVIIKTVNGGQSWTTELSSQEYVFNSIQFLDSNIGWAVGEDFFEANGGTGKTVVLNTIDGGQNWLTVEVTDIGNGLKDIYFTDDNHGWAVGRVGSIIHTTDGGNTWTPQTSGTGAWLYSVQFVDSLTGWIGGDFPRGGAVILKTSDGGNSWVLQNIPSDLTGFRSIYFLDQNTGWAAGTVGEILYTSDAGNNWELQQSGTTKWLNSVYFSSNKHGWAVGNDGVILKCTKSIPQNIITITNINDSGPGSLRQALLDANAEQGLNVLNFNIPGAGPHTIQPNSALPTVTDAVVIDGYAQPGASPNTNPNTISNNAVLKIELDGTKAGSSTDGLQISAGSSVVRGLVINRFGGDGIYLLNRGGNIIEGVYIGTDITGSTDLGNGRAGISIVPSSPNNTIGGTTNSARCVLSGNRWEVIADSDGNIVAGNFIGIDATGTSAIGLSSGTGILIQTSKNNVIGGSSAESRNVISGESMGVNIAAVASGNRVQGNFIGTDVSGTIALGNGTGVFIQASFTAGPKNNIVGGPAPGEGNVISGNTRGVFIEDDDLVGTTGNLIQGNLIGTDVSGTSALGNVTYGVEVRGASDNTIGGNSAGEGNIIANNGQAGVFVNNTFPGGVPPSGVLILSNSIFSNGGLGIDLRGPSAGSTPNDAGDPDTGPNNLQNFPEIALLRLADNGELAVQFRVDSDPSNSTYPLTIQFFASDASGEGKRLLGDDLYTITDFNQESKLVSLGNATELEINAGDSIVATATDFNGNTSEFSAISTLRWPDISVSPGSFEFSLNSGEAATEVMTIENSGEGVLNFSIRNEKQGTAGTSNDRKLYWSVNLDSAPNTLYRSNLDGTGVENNFMGDAALRGIAVDETRARVYWADRSAGGSIWSSNLDGSDVRVLISGLPQPLDIVIDPLAGKMYWTDFSAQTISRANLDGSGVEVIIQGTALAAQVMVGPLAKGEARRNSQRVSASLLDGPWGIALDLLEGKVYWAEQNGDRISRANLNGTGVETIITTELNGPRGIKVDAEAGKIYFVDSFNNSIKQANLDGTGMATLLSFQTDVNPLDIELDIDSNQFYWSDNFLGRIQRADFDGSNAEILVDDPMPNFQGPFAVGLFLGSGWLTEDPTAGTVQPGSNLEITINVDAANLNAGTYQTNIVIASNDPTQPEVFVPVTLTVAGAPRIVVSNDSLNYGSVNIGAAVTRSLTVSNRGTDVLTVSDISSDNVYYTLDLNSFILNPGESQDVEVVFTPTAPGAFPASLTITSDDPDKPNVTVALQGMAVLGSPTNLTAAVTQDSVILNWSPPGISGAIINETEPNNTLEQANPLNFGETARGTIDPVGDGDLWWFDGAAGQNIIIDIDAQINGSSLDALIGLFIEEDRDGDGGPDLIAFNDDFDGLDSRIAVTLAEANTYFILILDFEEGGGSNHFYDMSLTSSSATFTLTQMTPRKANRKEWTLSAEQLAEKLMDRFEVRTKNFSGKNNTQRRFARAGSQGLQSYKIYRSTTSPVEKTIDNLIGTVDTSTTTFVDVDLSPQIYYYVATAVYAAGESEPSNEVSVEILDSVAGILTVTNTLNSGIGSFRQAILTANARAGTDTIAFNISGDGPHTIQPQSALPIITDPVMIDGYTQPGAQPNTNSPELGTNAVLKIELNGSNAGAGVNGLVIVAGSSTVRGLAINRFVQGGGRTGEGIHLSTNGDNIVEGNFFGTDITGTIALGGSGVRILSGSNNTIGGTTLAARNIISGNGYGVAIDGRATDNLVQGNFIGTDVTGTVALGNQLDGIILGGRGNVIGGSAAWAGNLISGNRRRGIQMLGATATQIQSNYIGTDVTGTVALGNVGGGIIVFRSSDNAIGGLESGAGNLISGNGRYGIAILSETSLRNQVWGNSIYSNQGLGIDLGPATGCCGDGITVNDAGDGDSGANNLQNYPVISSAAIADVNVVVTYRVDSNPANSSYPLTIQFFEADPDGGGKALLARDTYSLADFSGGNKTIVLGNATELGINLDEAIVATATDSSGNTSEFSAIAPLENVTTVATSEPALPKAFALGQNYPNPFNPSTTIQFALPKRSYVTLKLFDITGKMVAVLVNGTLASGTHKVVLAANGLSSGVYFYRMTAGDFTQSKKLMLLK